MEPDQIVPVMLQKGLDYALGYLNLRQVKTIEKLRSAYKAKTPQETITAPDAICVSGTQNSEN
jgi:hypothetical protein